MPRTVQTIPQDTSLDELLERLGHISPRRVCLDPYPGLATKQDLVRMHSRSKLYELVDDTLVEKPMGFPEAHVGVKLAAVLQQYLDQHPIGFLAGADSLIELLPKLVRGPDLCFVSWDQLPERKIPAAQICKQIPDLVVELLSPSNTRGEMARKRKEYFIAGVKLVWILDPRKGTAEVYTSPDDKTQLGTDGILDGGEVLPGFVVALAKLVEELDLPKPKTTRKPPRKKK